ncbi:MAG: urease accessory protein UreF [Proteobacteria bacterium]|nr:MAG: urease accessory protein UreF [Pseudomonadota bacterium]
MSTDPLRLLATLQQADSFFPGGSIAFSWGLEALITDRAVDLRSELPAFLQGQLEHRWACFDRSALAAAYSVGANFDRVGAIDVQVEAMIIARELRDGSRRAGVSLLGVHERIDTPGAAEYRDRVRAEAAPGHLAVVQGLLWRGAGMTLGQAEAASAHTFCVSLLGAAIRLGAIGHLHAQRALVSIRTRLAEILAQPALSIDDCYAFTPMIEIAAMRHEMQSTRLFAN